MMVEHREIVARFLEKRCDWRSGDGASRPADVLIPILLLRCGGFHPCRTARSAVAPCWVYALSICATAWHAVALLASQERRDGDEELRPAAPALALAAGLGLQQRDELGVVEVRLVLLAGDLQ